MRSKAPLALMEQMVMVLVFALAAALCLQAFALADRISRQNAERDHALIAAQNAAEQIKQVRGDWDLAVERYGGTWNGVMWGDGLDSDWNRGAGQAYHLLVTPGESGSKFLGTADVAVYAADGRWICGLTVAWQQEVEHNG